MSEAQATQPVVTPTDAQPQAGAEVTDARNEDTLDTLLKTYDQQTQPAAQPQTTNPPERKPDTPDLNVLASRVESFVNEAHNIQFKRDMTETVKQVRGDLDPDVFDDVLVESWLDAEARRDPRLAKAWTDRHANPKQFERVKAELGKSFTKKFSKLPDKQVTEDRESVAAAVRGASTPRPESKPLNVSNLSNKQAADEIEKNFGYRPAFG